MKHRLLLLLLTLLAWNLSLMAQDKGALSITIDSLKWKPSVKHITYKIGNLTARETWVNKILVDETFLVDGKLNGIQREFYEDGKIKSIKGYAYGVEVGTWQWFYPNGSVERKFEYTDFTSKDLERKELVDTSIHSSAVSIDSIFIPQGKKRPKFCFFYHQDGTLEKEEHFENDKKSGKWKYYSLSGILIKEEDYKDGKLIKTEKH